MANSMYLFRNALRQGKILNGFQAYPHSIPWQVGIFGPVNGKTTLYCGGTILNKYHVLTAGHCTTGIKKKDIQVWTGLHNWKDKDEGAIRHKIKCIITYPGFVGEVYDKYSTQEL